MVTLITLVTVTVGLGSLGQVRQDDPVRETVERLRRFDAEQRRQALVSGESQAFRVAAGEVVGSQDGRSVFGADLPAGVVIRWLPDGAEEDGNSRIVYAADGSTPDGVWSVRGFDGRQDHWVAGLSGQWLERP